VLDVQPKLTARVRLLEPAGEAAHGEHCCHQAIVDSPVTGESITECPEGRVASRQWFRQAAAMLGLWASWWTCSGQVAQGGHDLGQLPVWIWESVFALAWLWPFANTAGAWANNGVCLPRPHPERE
jgi:hypothetical protein